MMIFDGKLLVYKGGYLSKTKQVDPDLIAFSLKKSSRNDTKKPWQPWQEVSKKPWGYQNRERRMVYFMEIPTNMDEN